MTTIQIIIICALHAFSIFNLVTYHRLTIKKGFCGYNRNGVLLQVAGHSFSIIVFIALAFFANIYFFYGFSAFSLFGGIYQRVQTIKVLKSLTHFNL